MTNKPWLKNYDPGVPKTIPYPHCAIHHFLESSAAKYPHNPCTIYQNNPTSYADVNLLASRLAGFLQYHNLQKGERVGIWLPNIPQFVVAFYGVLKAGGVVVAFNPLYKTPEVEHQMRDAGVRWMITLESLVPTIQQFTNKHGIRIITTSAQQAQALTSLLVESRPIHKIMESRLHLSSILNIAYEEVLSENSSENDAAIFQYTGGTTGIPKGAVGLHRNLIANTLMFSRWLIGLQPGKEVVLAAIPLYHVYGMVIAMNMGIYLGATLVLVDNPRNTEEILANITQYHATLFPGVPNLYNAINNHPAVIAGNFDLRSIKACISGASPLMQWTKVRFESLTGGRLMEGYGLSEAPTATHCNPMLGENRTGSIGLPLPDVDCKIVDIHDETTEMSIGLPGELIIKSPQIMMEYHNMPEETKKAVRDGWLYTGDIGRMDEQGYFYLVDRKKDLIKIGGYQVWPSEVEEVINNHPDVTESAVAGVPDPYYGESVKAWVVMKSSKKITDEAIKEWCEISLAHFKVPVLVEFRNELPRSTVGKVLRRELIRQHIENI